MPVLFAAGLLYLGRQCEGQTPDMLATSVQAAASQQVSDAQLIVRNPVTGAQLDQLSVRVVQIPRSGGVPQHPGLGSRELVVAEEAASPLNLVDRALSDPKSERVYYVGSPGYAWKALSFDPTQSGTREVQLAEGGSLSIGFEQVPAEARLRLRLQDHIGGMPSFESKASKQGLVKIEGLVAGTYRASIELDDPMHGSMILAEAVVVVRGGRSSEYQLNACMPRAK